MSPSIDVLVVDDSPTARQLLVHIVNSSPDMHVVAEASNGQQAIDLARKLRPTIILMDIIMPKVDGLEATREIMRVIPTPIVLTTATLQNQETNIAFQATSLGALTVLQKPAGPQDPAFEKQASTLLATLRSMSGVIVIHHKRGTGKLAEKPGDPPAPPEYSPSHSPEIIAIASSTGGPAALAAIVSNLPDDFRLPVVIVQHMASDFVPSLMTWLSRITSLSVSIAEAGKSPQAGHIYLAPGDFHLELTRRRHFSLDHDRRGKAHVPSGDILFESVAANYGPHAIGVILTGMGNDGAHGMAEMFGEGAYNIAQDEASSVVFSMPREAIALRAIHEVLPIDKVAGRLALLAQIKDKRSENAGVAKDHAD